MSANTFAELLKQIDVAAVDLEQRGLLEHHPENADVHRITPAGSEAAMEIACGMRPDDLLLIFQVCLDMAPGTSCSLADAADDVVAEIGEFRFEETIDKLASEDRKVLDRLLDAAVQMVGGDAENQEDRMVVRAGFLTGYAVGRLVELWEPSEERDESRERQAK